MTDRLEKGCLAIVIKIDARVPDLKYGEIVLCAEYMPKDSEIQQGRFGYQLATAPGFWWVQNRHGQWLHHETGLRRLHGGDGEDEMVKIVGKPPNGKVSA